MSKEYVVISHPDWWKVVKKEAKPRWIDMEGGGFSMSVRFDKKLSKQLVKDPLLQARLTEPASELWKKMVDEMVAETRKLDAAFEDAWFEVRDTGDHATFRKAVDKIEKDHRSSFERMPKKYVAKMEAAVLDGWAAVQRANAEARRFKTKIIVDNGMRGVTIALAVANLALSGGTNVLAWQSLVKDTNKTVQELYKVFLELENLETSMARHIRAVAEALELDRRKKRGEDAYVALLTGLIGPVGVATVETISKELGYYKGKLDVAEAGLSKTSKKLHATLEKMDAAKKGMPRSLEAQLQTLRGEVVNYLDALASTHATVERGRRFEEKARKDVKTISDTRGMHKLGTVAKTVESLIDLTKSTYGWAKGVEGAVKLGMTIVGNINSFGKIVERHHNGVSSALNRLAG